MTWLPSCSNIPVAGTVPAPAKWLDLIRRRPDLVCANPAVVRMTVKRFMQLGQAQAFGNRLPYRKDNGDHWDVAGPEGGDCEDLALAKIVWLRENGWPAGALRLALCRVSRPGGSRKGEPRVVWQDHANAQVESDHGTFVLDNLRTYFRGWPRLINYQWLWRYEPGEERWQRMVPKRTS